VSQAEAIGIMDPAFFVPKNVLIKWVNDVFQAGIKKVEDMATGAVYCQVLDAIYPGKVPLHKVNFAAKYDYEWLKNWKVIQEVFTQQAIQKPVDINKLVKAKYQDNLEFMQWMKNFFDSKYGGQPYDAVARRQQVSKGGKSGFTAPSSIAIVKPNAAPAKAKSKVSTSHSSGSGGGTSSAEVEQMRSQLAEQKAIVEGLETEKAFYFGKLRSIELACQEEESEVISKAHVLRILYQEDSNATSGAAEAGAETVAEEGQAEAAAADQDSY